MSAYRTPGEATTPIIIKTPQPDTEERLVLVPPGCPLPVLARDATPDDLLRAGYVKQPAKDRATDEELVDLYRKVYETHGGAYIPAFCDYRRAAVLAVAARVRQERCIVAQAVAANVDIRVCEDDGGGFMVGVHESGCDEELARCVPAADVPATLARLLGEVSRG